MAMRGKKQAETHLLFTMVGENKITINVTVPNS